MKKSVLLAAFLWLLFMNGFVSAGNGSPIDLGSADKSLSLAVYGDWPYSTTLLSEAPLLLNSINSDARVRIVAHVGDIHSGKMPCTGANLDPIPGTANPGWNQGIFDIFEKFKDPVIYTPGDNEWTDCHKANEGSSGYPLFELTAVRNLFFASPGYSLGGRKKAVLTQSSSYDPSFPKDSQFVENVMWEESSVVFVTLNVPGSNNDTLAWTGGFSNPAAQAQEVSERSAANLRWLDAAFAQAENDHAKGILILLQADMWDLSALGGDGLDQYDEFVQELANLCNGFNGKVLLINGDSHVYEADEPLADPTSATGQIHGTQAVSNLKRITVEGSTAADEWLRLNINPASAEIFSWDRVQYLP